MTRQRVLVFDAVFRVHGHVDAEELAGHLRKPGSRVSRASVYRTLDLLAEAGLVKPTRLGERQRFYEHVHGGEHHDHLVCEVCGRLIEFYSPEIEKLQEKVCRENSFEPARHTMIVYGVCEECRRKKTVR
jgi:Fur family ferric uptake transcriptional regulator